MMLDFVVPVTAEVVEAETVGFRINDLEKPRFKGDQLGGIHLALEYRILDALPEIKAGLRCAAQAAMSAAEQEMSQPKQAMPSSL